MGTRPFGAMTDPLFALFDKADRADSTPSASPQESRMILADTIARAREVDLVATAEGLGASLKRVTATELAGPCLVCAGHDRFSVNRKRQIWHCRRCDAGGDVIALVRHVRGIGFGEAVDFLTGGRSMPVPPYARPKPTAPPPKPEPEDKAFVAKLIADITWRLVPVRGTPGEQYFAAARKIDTDAIADVLERTDAIGWHSAVLFREDGHALDGERLGCIVGRMTDAITAKPTGAISRTYLHEGGKVGKAKTLGQPAGIVRLSEDADVLAGLHIAEGLETALTMMACDFRPMWATGSTALMAKLPALSGIEALTVFVDHDENGAGEKAARETEKRWLSAGREVRLLRPNALGDFNDAIRKAANWNGD